MDDTNDQLAAAVVEGDIHTCSIMSQTAEFWVIDLGFCVAVDEVTIFSAIGAGSITLYTA